MVSVATKASLSSNQRRLLELLQLHNFGKVENLVIAGGEPVFDPPPCIVRDVKFGCENGPRPELSAEDFALKAEVIDLFSELSRIEDGTYVCIEFKHGLPFRMKVNEKFGG